MESEKDKNVRDEIVLSAQKLFQQFGLKKTTMDEIVADCEKAKSTLYHYFKSKEEVYEAVVDVELVNLRRHVKVLVDGHKSLNGRDQNATRVYHTHALTKCSNACQSNKISSKRGSLSQGQPTLCMYRARLLCYM